MTGEPDRPYDAIPGFGGLYDAVPAYAARRDVQFYLAQAARAKGPILELGCGTGRILIPLARAGHTVVGLDGSAAMLEQCAAKLRDEPDDVRARVTLHEGDARDFDLDRRFDLVIAPFRVLQHLVAVEDQLRLLAAVGRHLAPDGRFVFDVFNPDVRALLSHDGTEHEDTPETTLPDGRTLRRAARVPRVRWLDQVNEVELVYYVSPRAGAPAARHVQSFEMRWYLRHEVVHLLARGGFVVEAMHGDFDAGPLVDGAPEIVVSARTGRPSA
jgi:SAM-dependent methyltransferase